MTTSMKNDTDRFFKSEDWSKEDSITAAAAEDLQLTDDHFSVLHALQEFYSRHEINQINRRELHDALEEKFHHKGGMKFLYNLFPGGPVAQGCRLAGLQPPAGAEDKGFGSAV